METPSELLNKSMRGKKAVLLVTSTMTVMSGATISPTLPALQTHFRAVPNIEILAPLVLTITALAIAFFAPLAGLIIDWFGRKKLLLSGLILYGLSGSCGLYLDSVWGLIVGRAVLGMAVAAVMTCSTTLVADYLTGAERQRFIGLQIAFMNFGGVVFIVCGGFLSDISWRAPFAIYLVSFIVFPAVLLKIEETKQRIKPDEDKSSPSPSRQPILWRHITLLYALGMFGWIVFYLIMVRVPFHLKELMGASGTQIGIATGYWSFIAAILSAWYGFFRKRFSYHAIFAGLFLISGIGFWVLAYAGSYWTVMLAMTLCGAGFGLLMPNNSVWLAELAPEYARGRLLGGMTTCNFFGQFLSPLVFQPVIAFSGLYGILGVFGTAGNLTIALGLCFLIWSISITSKRG
jgi:MFS family permease